MTERIRLNSRFRLRQATIDDAEALADFNSEMFNPALGETVRLMMHGIHPTVQADDFALIEDTQADNKVVSTAGVINRTWAYAGIPISVGYVEFIGTLADYRRQGLMAAVMTEAHRICAEHNHHMTLISGIPWFYKKFGYTYALEGGYREHALVHIPYLFGNATPYKLRDATIDDIPILAELYDAMVKDYQVSSERAPDHWRFHIERPSNHDTLEAYHLLLDADDSPVGYYGVWGHRPYGPRTLREIASRPGLPLINIIPSVLYHIYTYVQDNMSSFGGDPPTTVRCQFPESHPFFNARDAGLTPYKGSAWYVRIPDISRFLMQIAPVLNERLEASAFNGFDGELHISEYTSGLKMTFTQGQLTKVEDWQPPMIDEGSDARFPPGTFTQLVMGYRSMDDLLAWHADCWANRVTRQTLDILFPEAASWAIY